MTPLAVDLLVVYKIFFPETFEIDIDGKKLPLKQIDLNPQRVLDQANLLEN